MALTQIPGLGCRTARQLLELCPDPEKLFAMSRPQLRELFGHHDDIIRAIESREALANAEKEIPLLEKSGIRTLFCSEAEYPQRLNNAPDTPVLLYCYGTCNLNPQHVVAFVGSRKCTDYGRTATTRIVQEMKSDGTLIVSGLAYGIDAAAHTAAVDCGLPTVAVLGHGLDMIYPHQNRGLAQRIVADGGALVTEYPLRTAINAGYFPARNRIVAALSDAVVVAESAERGGALITANLAAGYHREVFAVPGRLDDPMSEGCNNLIVNNKAIMLRNAGDLFYQMGWKNDFCRARQREEQQSLFATLTADEQRLAALLQKNREMTLDDLVAQSDLSLPKVASLLLEMELKDAVRCLPGRIYKLN